MVIEAQRGCGFRKVGGLYLCGGGHGMTCDRLPYELKVCPVCGSGVKFSRGFQWLDWKRYAGSHYLEETEHPLAKIICHCNLVCPVCYPEISQPYGLLFVGEAFYTPQSFIQEAIQMGVSRRIAAIPKNLKLGKTWVLFAHKHVVEKLIVESVQEAWDEVRQGKTPELGETVKVPGVFYAFRPQTIELLIWKSDATPEHLAELVKKNITPIIIPDGDVDHDPRTSLKPKAEEKDKLLFNSLRQRLGGKS